MERYSLIHIYIRTCFLNKFNQFLNNSRIFFSIDSTFIILFIFPFILVVIFVFVLNLIILFFIYINYVIPFKIVSHYLPLQMLLCYKKNCFVYFTTTTKKLNRNKIKHKYNMVSYLDVVEMYLHRMLL